MKNSELLLATSLIAVVAGVGASLATRAIASPSARAESPERATPAGALAQPSAAPAQTNDPSMNELRMANAALEDRVATLEARLAQAQGARTPVETDSVAVAPTAGGASGPGSAALTAGGGVSPEFVANVGRAMDTIRAKEEAEREKKRKEVAAQRIEDKVTELQQELGLTGLQAINLRTALTTADEKREALFASMRDDTASGDPRQIRESMHSLRDETYATLQTILSPTQFDAFKQKEESDWGRRGDFGPGGMGGPDGGGMGRQGRPGRSADGGGDGSASGRRGR